MKRIVLLLAACFTFGIAAQAAENHPPRKVDRSRIDLDQNLMQPVVFIENGIEFLVYPDGALDFNVTPSSVRLNGQYVREIYNPGRYDVYRTGHNYRRGYVQYNRMGLPVQIGRLSLDYLRDGRVVRIGNIPINYKKGRLDRIGNLKVHYDRSGRIYKQTGFIDKYKKADDCDMGSIEIIGDRSRRS